MIRPWPRARAHRLSIARIPGISVLVLAGSLVGCASPRVPPPPFMQVWNRSRSTVEAIKIKPCGTGDESFEMVPGSKLPPGAGVLVPLREGCVDAGRAIWFYQWTKAEEVSHDLEAEILASCSGAQCFRVIPKGSQKETSGSLVRAGGIEAVSLTGRPANEEEALYHGLMRELITDLVGRFAKGAAAMPSAPAPQQAVPPAAGG